MNAFWKSFARRLFFLVPHRHDLGILARKYGTDKYSNHYVEAYRRHFATLRRQRLNVLEIGVGGGKHPARGGASLRMWKDYFPRAMIYGIDIHDKRCHADRRIQIYQGDQSDPAFLQDVARRIGRLDIVIDDGSHLNEHVKVSFTTLFPLLPEGGIYAIEDLCTAYWPQYGGEWERLDNHFTSMAMLKRLVDGLHHNKIPNYVPGPFDGQISSICFYPSLAFVFKGVNQPVLTAIDRQILAAYQ